MELDTRTTIIASFLVAGLLAGTALVFARSTPAPMRGADPLRLWGTGLALLAVGYLGVATRGLLPDFVSIVVANTLIVAALVVSNRALRAFRGAPGSDATGWIATAATFLVLWFLLDVWPDLRARIVVLSVVRAWLLARNALELGRAVPAECRLSFGFTRAVFWVAAAAMIARAALAATTPLEPDFFAPNPLHSWSYLVFAGVCVAATLGVYWMMVQLLQRELVVSATHDALTGLFNRQAFLAEFEREASRSARGNAPFSLAVFDLDRFKALNDMYGHPAGDEALRLVAATMRQCLRRHDVLGRLGGEEFALLMPGTAREDALMVAERIRAGIEQLHYAVKGERISLSVSGGLATRGRDGADWDTLFAAADRALYGAKHAGRNKMAAA